MTFADYLVRMVAVALISASTSLALLFCLYKFIRSREAAEQVASFSQQTMHFAATQAAGFSSMHIPGRAVVRIEWRDLHEFKRLQPTNVGPPILGQASISTRSMPASQFVRRMPEVDPSNKGSLREQTVALELA